MPKTYLVNLIFLFLFLEISSAFFILIQKSYRNSNYIERDISFPKLVISREKWFINFYRSLKDSDSLVKKSALINGWDQMPLGYVYDKNNESFANNLSDGTRLNPNNSNIKKSKYSLSSYGDSFIRGDEVSDNETFQYYLSKDLNSKVFNYGVSGFSPLQSLIKYSINDRDNSNFVILGILSENIMRLGYLARENYLIGSNLKTFTPNLIQNISTNETELILPFDNKVLKKLFFNLEKGNPIDKYSLKTREKWYLRNKNYDLFSIDSKNKAKLRFPFSYNLIKSFIVKNCIYGKANLEICSRYPGWKNRVFVYKLNKIINCFEEIAYKRGQIPIILFIPKETDISSPHYRDFFNSYKQKNSTSILIDSAKEVKNIEEFHNTHGGHASKYGNKVIASAIIKKRDQILVKEKIKQLNNKDNVISETFCKQIYYLKNIFE